MSFKFFVNCFKIVNHPKLNYNHRGTEKKRVRSYELRVNYKCPVDC
jgi:hypothetical protein